MSIDRCLSGTGAAPVLLSLMLAACASSGATPPATDATGAEGSVAADDEACETYARRMCEEVGPRSETCRAAVAVVAMMSPRACLRGLDDWDVTLERIGTLRADCTEVQRLVCERMGAESESCQAIRADLDAIPPGHCQALRREAPRLIAQIEQREAMRKPLSDEQWAALTADDAPSFGKADAEVVLVEFSDFECPYCARAAETVEQIEESYGDRVRFVFRQYPLPFHRHAQAAAQAALAAHEQGKFWQYHDLLFEEQDALDTEALEARAEKLELDMEAFRAAAAGGKTAQRVADDLELGDDVHVRGTPTLFVDGRRVENALDFEQVSAAIDEALREHGKAEAQPAAAATEP